MSKKNIIILFITVAIFLPSCKKLELQPKGILGESELFGNDFGVKKYFVALYNNLPIEDFNYYAANTSNGYDHEPHWDAPKYSLGNMSGEFFNQWVATVNNSGFGYWPYNFIRDVNVFIDDFPNYRDDFPEEVYKNYLGEAHFLRAFYYFGLAKRYGGVPIIKEAQDPTADIETLKVHRNTEYDTWKFIYEDLLFAIQNMQESSETGRANKYVAAALMSRAMLYAGSVAKYSQYLNFDSQESFIQGVAGMKESDAKEFFQYCVDAGNMFEDSPYSLYTKDYPDKALNFANLFIDPASSESIFIKKYDRNAPRRNRLSHTYDANMSPFPDFSSFIGTQSYPMLDFMELYEFPNYVKTDGTPVFFTNRGDIRNGMEPRLKGTMYFNEDELRGKTFSIQKGIYRTYNGVASDAQMGSATAPINDKSNRIIGNRGEKVNINGAEYLITGEHGEFVDRNSENNGYGAGFIRKYVDPNISSSDAKDYGSEQSWVVFRLGEIYLNSAEALYELSRRDEAFDYVERIRDRAGVINKRPAIDQSQTNIYPVNSAVCNYDVEESLQFIRVERERELYGENHWWWDLRRWRIADQVLNNFSHRALSCYFVADRKKYIYLEENSRYNRRWTASRGSYYEPIPSNEIAKNDNLLPQNPLY